MNVIQWTHIHTKKQASGKMFIYSIESWIAIRYTKIIGFQNKLFNPIKILGGQRFIPIRIAKLKGTSYVLFRFSSKDYQIFLNETRVCLFVAQLVLKVIGVMKSLKRLFNIYIHMHHYINMTKIYEIIFQLKYHITMAIGNFRLIEWCMKCNKKYISPNQITKKKEKVMNTH